MRVFYLASDVYSQDVFKAGEEGDIISAALVALLPPSQPHFQDLYQSQQEKSATTLTD